MKKMLAIGLIAIFIGLTTVPLVNSQLIERKVVDNITVSHTVETIALNTPPFVEIQTPHFATFWIFGRELPYPGRPLMDEPAIIIGNMYAAVYAVDDESGIQKVEFYLDNTLAATKTEPQEGRNIYYFPGVIGSCRLGFHEITAKAYDNAGNNATSNPVKIFYVGL